MKKPRSVDKPLRMEPIDGGHKLDGELPNYAKDASEPPRVFPYDNFTVGDATFSNVKIVYIHKDDGSTDAIFSATTTDSGYRGDVFLTLYPRLSGASIDHYSFPVVSVFCGTQDAVSTVAIDPTYYDTDPPHFDYTAPHWLPCV